MIRVSVAFDAKDIQHRLNGFGFVVPRTEKKSLMACTFVHRKFAGRAPKGKALLRVFVGGAFGKDVFAMPDGKLEEAVMNDLTPLLGLRKKPLFASLMRYTQSLPQYRVGHARLLKRIAFEEADLPGLYLTGSSYRGTGIPDCVRDAEAQAQRAWRSLNNA